MARPVQGLTGAVVAVLFAWVVLVLPDSAAAHVRTSVVAVDSRARVLPLQGRLRKAVAIRIYAGDLALGLTVRRGHNVVVLGYIGEPFLRIDATGLAVDESSPTAAATGMATLPGRSEGVGHGWTLRSNRRTAVWHDARVRGLPPGVRRVAWVVPLVVDGRRVRLQGEVWRVPAPSPWPWLALGVPFVALTALLLVRAGPRLRRAGVALGAVAAAVTVATAAAFSLAASASAETWVESTNELAFVLFGLSVIAWGSRSARSLAAGGLGWLAVFVGLSRLSVFEHGVVLSELPAALTRAAVDSAIWVGAAAALVGLAVLIDER